MQRQRILADGGGRVGQTHTHTEFTHFHTSSHQRGIQNTTGIARIPCSLLSKYNASLLVHLWKQAGAIETETGCSQDTSCFWFCSFPASALVSHFVRTARLFLTLGALSFLERAHIPCVLAHLDFWLECTRVLKGVVCEM